MKVFVYGTLKRGYGNNRLLNGCQFVKEALISGMSMYYSGSEGSFPVIKFGGDGLVKGEVWDISMRPEAIHYMDALEGTPHLYTREALVTECKEQVFAYVGGRYFEHANLLPVPETNNVYEWNR